MVRIAIWSAFVLANLLFHGKFAALAIGQGAQKPLRDRLIACGATITEVTGRWDIKTIRRVETELTEVKFEVIRERIEIIEGLDIITGPRWRDLDRDQLLSYRFTNADAIRCGKEKTIRVLSIPLTGVTDEFLKQYESLEELTHLDLSFNKITDEGVKHLAKAVNLKELRLAKTEITDEAAKHLAELKNLEWLDVSRTTITDKFALTILKMRHLKHVDISASQLSHDVAIDLRGKKPPRRRLSVDD